jgi:8-oxo-dGTP pyrophosphatase MutT (NUDIX family)
MTMAEHSSSISFAEHRKAFSNALPETRLGQQQDCLEAFQEARTNHPNPPVRIRQQKEFSLVVVTEQPRRILLGMKHRGFGKGMYNSFGGKRERGESYTQCACRELEEEAGIVVATNRMADSQLGVLHITFQDNTVEMVVHVFRVDVTTTNASGTTAALRLDPLTIRGCEEITPVWFEDFHQMPLDNMFADDSIWLCYALATNNTKVDGWFHFLGGGQETNSILQYYVKTSPVPEQPSSSSENPGAAPSSSRPLSLERRLFHALHDKSIQSQKLLSIKEFNEAYAFMNALRIRKTDIDIVIDVAGGHGALAALFLVTTSAVQATVVDPARVGNVQRAWGDFFPDKTLRYRHECLRTGLPAELQAALQSACRTRILVVACHACQHLSDETVEIACRHGVNVAVMPCCQKDTGESWKDTSKNINIPIAKVMDILLAGKVMSWTSGQQAGVEYDVRMKVIDEKITPQNRIILCRSRLLSSRKNEAKEYAHRKLQLAYKRAHVGKPHREETGLPTLSIASGCCLVVAGFTLGVVCSVSFFKKR